MLFNDVSYVFFFCVNHLYSYLTGHLIKSKTYNEIEHAVKIPVVERKRCLQSLACVKGNKVLRKQPMSKDSRFLPNPVVIKNRTELLSDRKFLERDRDDFVDMKVCELETVEFDRGYNKDRRRECVPD
ncbi:hypothetical protein L1987_45571 [Smallanthus sonchifolius]|uniref:Uncharacterized protein n=1 Tax=Smallanthus sonchifolius TaxID=185202 RepID=A0ACB9FX67_9ASTR|nr:hypothetical protein L1987_45571 [Smallanthus sonchifolius]